MGEKDYRMDRRNLLKTGAALATGAGLAGCTNEDEDRPVSTPDDNSSTDSGSDEDSEPENQGLQLGFNWDDVLEAEQEFFMDQASFSVDGESAWDIADPSYIRQANLADYREFQESLVNTINEITAYFGENLDSYSSSSTQNAAAAVNIILSDVLEDQEMEAKMMPLSYSGHGYTQVASTEHPLTLVDSNWPAVGPTTERPLQERPNSKAQDPIGFFDEDSLLEEDTEAFFERATVLDTIRSIYSVDYDTTDKFGVPSQNLFEFADEALRAENGELFIGPVRDVFSALSMLYVKNGENALFEYMGEDPKDYESFAIDSLPSELPTKGGDSVSTYIESLADDSHIYPIESKDEAEDMFYQAP